MLELIVNNIFLISFWLFWLGFAINVITLAITGNNMKITRYNVYMIFPLFVPFFVLVLFDDFD